MSLQETTEQIGYVLRFSMDTENTNSSKRSLPEDGRIEPEKAQTTKGNLSPSRATGNHRLPAVSPTVGSDYQKAVTRENRAIVAHRILDVGRMTEGAMPSACTYKIFLGRGE
jgi:hypothetical protein